MVLNLNYKGFKLAIDVEQKEGNTFIINSLSEINGESPKIEAFKTTIFFDFYVGEEFDRTESDKLERRIKRSLAKFLKESEETPEAYVEDAVVVEEVVSTTPKKKDNKPEGAIDRIIFETVERALGSDTSKAEIDGLIKQLIKENGVVPFQKILKVQKGEEPPKPTGLQHVEFERILKTIMAKVPIALVGPAGSGKTTIVANVSKTLDIPFASQSVSAQSTVFDFFGYKNAAGEYTSTLFREKYENGGVFLLDEFDAGNPNVLAALNQATANELAPFPDKMVKKHDDFIIVMAGNTFGGGGTIDYVGRNKIDAATLDRFAFIHVDYDEDLEEALSTNANWCRRVQAYRKKASEKKVRTIISPRATFHGEKLLAAGLTQSQAEEMVIFKGLTQDERNLIKL